VTEVNYCKNLGELRTCCRKSFVRCWSVTIIIFYFARGSGCEVLWWVRLRVCLSACLSARIFPEPHARSLPFLCMLLMTVARSSTGVVEIRYVFPVLWMTSFLSTMGRIAVWISLRRTDFASIYFFAAKSERI